MQCNEPRTDDAPPADINMSNQSSLGKKGQEAGQCIVCHQVVSILFPCDEVI